MSWKSKDAKKLKEYNIVAVRKGLIITSIEDGKDVVEYHQFDKIHEIIHHPGRGVEIVGHNKYRKMYYNDKEGESEIIRDAIINQMINWMSSNAN